MLDFEYMYYRCWDVGIKITTEVLKKSESRLSFFGEPISRLASDLDNKIEITIPLKILLIIWDQIRKILLEATEQICHERLTNTNQLSLLETWLLSLAQHTASLSQMLKNNIKREIICLTILPFGFRKKSYFVAEYSFFLMQIR